MGKLRLFLFLILLFLGSSIKAGTIIVCGSCETGTIKEAIAKAADFDTIVVKSGTYREFNIEIHKPLTLFGEDLPVIDGGKQGAIVTIFSDNVTLDGFRIINVGTSYTSDNAAVRVVRSENFTIQNLVLEKLFFGIYLEKSKNGKVLHNRITGDAIDEYNSGNAIQLWYSQHVLVADNWVERARDGIYLEFSDFITIVNNVSTKNIRYGLHFMFSNDDVYENNTFENNAAGVAVMFSKRINMLGNTFKNNWGAASFGLLLKEINDAEIVGNTFENNTTWISIEGSNRINYRNNNFIGNGWAVKVRGACYANIFSNNNFIFNSFDLAYNGHLNDNLFDGNYWSDYTGYDLDRDGTGDVPYRPVKLFSYIVNKTPETIILLRSLFMDIIDFSEKVSPVFTPNELIDANPLMRKNP